MTPATPAELETRWQRARSQLDAGQVPAAIAELEALVTIEPRQPAAWLMLARLARTGQQCRAAVGHARNAAAAVHESGDLRPLADIALLLQALGESPLAVRLIQSVDPAHPQVVAATDRLAQCLGQADFHQEALGLLDAALDRGPPTPMLRFMRATTLRHLGRKEEATAEYLLCLQLAPGYGAAMLMLAQHDSSAEPAAQLARIRKTLAQAPQQDDLNAAMLHYAEFIHLDRAGDAAAAWMSLMRGAAIKRNNLAWSPERDEERIAVLRDVCRDGFLDPAPAGGAERVPIFIVGQPRTGTTVLERILGNHSQVASAGELNDFHLQLCWQADLLVEHVDPALLRACPALDFGAIGRGYRQRTGWRRRDKRFLIDKLPGNFWYAGLIRKALPEARIVCLLRDPLDTCLSNLKELFAGTAYPYSYDPLDAATHHLHFRQMLQYWDEVMPGVVLTVRYEELVREPLRIARAVMDHCGLPFEPDCVDLLRNAAPSATASSSQVREPLHARGIGAWRRYAAPLAEAREYLRTRLPADEFMAGF